MALYHFNWEGKERTVSVRRVALNLLSFRFIDAEIIQRVASHLLLEKAINSYEYRNREEIVSLEAATSVVTSIEAAVKGLAAK